MNIEQLLPILSRVKGCTFASIDAETKKGGLIHRVTNERVILFTNQNSSGYENLVRRRLAELGKDPSTFTSGDLSWGERVPNTPLIRHRGFYYLPTVLMYEGHHEYFMPDGKPAPRVFVDAILGDKKGNNQGLPDEKTVKVRNYALENIKGIRLLGESLPKRKTLSIKT